MTGFLRAGGLRSAGFRVPALSASGPTARISLASVFLPLALVAAAGLTAGCDRGGDGSASAGLTDPEEASLSTDALRTDVNRLRKANNQYEAAIDKVTPQEPYIVINTTLNRLYLRKGSETLVDAVCSTGSNTQLIEANGKRRWFFSTPKGVFSVKNKMLAPVWVKPDWAFVEEGEPIPGPQAAERFEEGFLGRYGLYFGNGYLIHGTLFQRFLGQSVTHGCVRLGDADLEKVFQNSKVGTKIFIY